MKLKILFAGSLLCFLSQLAYPNPTRLTLPNGLEGFVLSRSEIPLVSIHFSIRHGYIYAEEARDEGLAHFYEHMLFKANSLTTNQQEFMQRLNELGAAGWNGTTSSEAVNYYLTVPPSSLDQALELWAAVLIDTIFEPNEIINELSVVSNEIEGNRGDPLRTFWKNLNAALYGPEEIYRTGHYETAHMGAFNRELLLREQERWYTPDNCLIGLAGAIEAKEALALITKHFGRWKSKARRPLTKELRALPRPEGQPNLIIGGNPNPDLSRVLMVWPGPATLSHRKETLVADVLSYLLSEQTGSFILNLKENTRIFSGESTSFGFSTGRYNSEFIFQTEIAKTAPEELVQIAKEIQEEVRLSLAQIVNGSFLIRPEALERIAQKIINQGIFRHEKPANLLSDLGWWWCVADTDYWQTYEEEIKLVKPEAIRALARDWLLRQELGLLWVHDSIKDELDRE